MEENKKKNDNKVYIVALAIAGIVIFGLVGYIFYEKTVLLNDTTNKETNMSNENSDNKKVDNTEKLDVNDSRFIGIYNDLKNYSYLSTRRSSADFSNSEYAYLVAKNLQEGDITKTSESWDYGSYYNLSGSKVENILTKYFGSNLNFDKNKLLSATISVNFSPNGEGNGMTFASYDGASDSYKLTFSGIGGMSGPSATITNQVIVSATRKNKEITVTSKAIYINVSDNVDGIQYDIYSDSNKTNLIDSKIYSYQEVDSQSISVENYLDKASNITYQFSQDEITNEYYFVSSTIG